jgi:ABC-type nitrate/sulfonate/bicarbonate transport system substrate-binding protein
MNNPVKGKTGGVLMYQARWVSLILFLLICPSWAYSQSKSPEVTIGYSGVGIAHDLLKIMAANRIFEKHGVNATSIYIGSGSLMNQAVVGGSIQFTTSDLPSQIQSAIAGIDFKTSALRSIDSTVPL